MSVIYNADVYADEFDEEDVYVNSTRPTVDEQKPTSDKKIPFVVPAAVQPFLPLAVCWVILLIILFVRIHFTAIISAKLSDQIEGSHILNQKLQNVNSLNEHLKQDRDNLNVQVNDRKRAQSLLENNIRDLNGEKDQLKREIQQLKTEKQSMIEDVQRLKAENQQLKESYKYSTAIPRMTMSVSPMNTTQHSSNTTSPYSFVAWMWTPHYRGRRQTELCQRGWLQFKSSCYMTSNRDSLDQKTWGGAQDDCRGRKSELVVIESPEEQDFIYSKVTGMGASDHWIGLRFKGGSWNWVDGHDLTDHYWIQPPADNASCVTSVRENSGWKAVNCDIKRSWICEQDTLSA